jgi:hypothetical protein
MNWYLDDGELTLFAYGSTLLSVFIGTVFSFALCTIFGAHLGRALWAASLVLGLFLLVLSVKVGFDDLAYFDSTYFYFGFFIPAISYRDEVLSKQARTS